MKSNGFMDDYGIAGTGHCIQLVAVLKTTTDANRFGDGKTRLTPLFAISSGSAGNAGLQHGSERLNSPSRGIASVFPSPNPHPSVFAECSLVGYSVLSGIVK